MDRTIILASTSPYRRALLDRLRLPYVAVAPRYEEVRDPARGPREQLEVHARGKAQSVIAAHPDAIVIGSDQGLIDAEGTLLGKPGTVDRAVEQLASLSGHTVELLTAITVIDGVSGRQLEHTDTTRLTFRTLPQAEIEAYVAADEPLDCAGSFKLESLGIALFERLEGRDPTNVIGLPLMALIDLLHELGVRVLRVGAT